MLLQTLCHPSFLRLPLGCWQTIKHPLYGKPCRVHFAFGGWERRNERTAARRKMQLPLQAQSEVCSRPKRNKWRGPAAGGEVAVYAGFGLEQTQRSARRVDLTTPTLAIKLSQEPHFNHAMHGFALLFSVARVGNLRLIFQKCVIVAH